MFATLAGSNTERSQHEEMFQRLCGIAIERGVAPGDTHLRIVSDQASLEKWSLALRGPADGQARFFLSVTAPKVLSLSPLPVMKTLSGPLFSVVVMPTFFGVWDEENFTEINDKDRVANTFEEFLDRL